MYNKNVFIFKKKQLLKYFQKEFNRINKWDYETDKHEVYFSNHFIERIIERQLENDKFIIKQIIDYFYENIFLQNGYTNRIYLLQLGVLRIPIQISYSTTKQMRIMIIKSVFDTDENYEFDEHIKLTANIK